MLGHVEDPQQTHSGVEGEAAQVGTRPLQVAGQQVVDHAARFVEVLHQILDAILHSLRNVAGVAVHHGASHVGLQHIVVDGPHGPVGTLKRVTAVTGRAGRFGPARRLLEVKALGARLGRAASTATQQQGHRQCPYTHMHMEVLAFYCD